MLGEIKLENRKSIIDPLRALNNVLTSVNDNVRVVYEFEDDTVHIGARSSSGGLGMYQLNVKDISENYQNPNDEIGIWEVGSFVNKLNLLDKDFKLSFDDGNKLNITTDDDNICVYTCDPVSIQKGKRRLKTELLDEAGSVVLNVQIKKLLQAMSSFDTQDIVQFYSEEGSTELTVIIKNDQNNTDVFESKIKNATIEKSIDLSFSKDQIKKVLSCNDEISLIFYTGKKDIVEFSYNKDSYDMKFYLSPIDES